MHILTVGNLYQVRDAKIKVLTSLKQDDDEERSEWKKLSTSLKVRAHRVNWPWYILKDIEGFCDEKSTILGF